MNLLKLDPSREMKAISGLWATIFGRPPHREPYHGIMPAPDWRLSVNISETDTDYLISGDIPGVNKEDVSVSMQDGMLVIQGERRIESEENGRRFNRRECLYGTFARSFRIPDDVEESAFEVEFHNGTFNLRLPKVVKKLEGNR